MYSINATKTQTVITNINSLQVQKHAWQCKSLRSHKATWLETSYSLTSTCWFLSSTSFYFGLISRVSVDATLSVPQSASTDRTFRPLGICSSYFSLFSVRVPCGYI